MWKRIRALLFGAPKDVHDQKTFHSISLIAMLAWVGLGADGLSSSAYGPPEAFKALVEKGEVNASLAIWLALGTALTVFIISYTYTRIIEHFPTGGGGYVVATKLLGPKFGVVSGSALLVDYMLTITTSVASGGDAIFDLIPRRWFDETEIFDEHGKLLKVVLRDGGTLFPADIAEKLDRAALGTWSDPVQRVKLVVEIGAIVLLILLNIRGVKESVATIVPIFMAFVATHVVLLGVSIGGHVGDVGTVAHETATNIHHSVATLGFFGALALTVRAYSLGGGTYTGIEAVSNGIQIMREPRVRTAKRTMVLMATSLALTAGGLVLAYLLVHVMPVEGKTMNGLLAEKVAGHWSLAGMPIGGWFVMLTLASEAGLLFVAAQAGFVDGPRVMANMAVDSWMPHRFAALSERLSMQNGVMLMGGTAIAALIYTHGDVTLLVTMYSINVFLTFSLSNLGMSRFWIQNRRTHPEWRKHLPVHLIGLALCVTILCVTSYEKFSEGGWLTLVVTTLVVVACLAMKRHYVRVGVAIRSLDEELPDPLPMADLKSPGKSVRALGSIADIESGAPKPDPTKPIAILFVGGYGGLGRHALLTMLRMFPHHFKGIVFCSIAIIDSGNFKGVAEVEELEARTRSELEKYIRYAATLDLPAEAVFATGIEVAVEAEKLGIELIEKYPRALFVAGQLVFEEETFVNRLLHNETAFMIQRRLQHSGVPMIVLPVRITLKSGPRLNGPSLTSERNDRSLTP
jgi:amino acid transporter